LDLFVSAFVPDVKGAGLMELHDHAAPFRVGRIFILLLVLTLATFASLYVRSQFASVWSTQTNTIFILLVAAAKAMLVILFFMHWKYERAWKYLLCVPTILLAIVAVLALLPDVAFETYQKTSWHGP
jgi:caa(3)-type oxidase subunit IV